MKLEGFEAGTAIVKLDVEDCAALAAICEVSLQDPGELEAHQALNAARTYTTVFQALAIAAATPGFLQGTSAQEWLVELKDHGLDGLIKGHGPWDV